jgi:peptide/nickel transport system substrate-binding protein
MQGRPSLRTFLHVSLVVVALSLPSCEDGGNDAQVRNGGSITIAQTSRPDFLDPALSYTAGGWEPMWLVYTPPVTYKREEGEEGTELIPGLAKALPEVSEDGRTVSFRFRHGLRFSDGTPLEASDFEHTIKRVLMLSPAGRGSISTSQAPGSTSTSAIRAVTSPGSRRTIEAARSRST